ncbi:helix-turn-helix domain-containing protein [Mycoplasma sp. P36-A1]|uniref:helix-turn-helix domain-containing protein n=1 Tax=Mycoplasma sp. P36-A1 TaxID=3252900 RepID=UPI003C2B174B
MLNYESLGNKIKQERINRGWSQNDIAVNLKVSRQLVSKWENGISSPDLERLIELSLLFKINLNEFIKEAYQYTHENDESKQLIKSSQEEEYNKSKKLFLMFQYTIVFLILIQIVLKAFYLIKYYN